MTRIKKFIVPVLCAVFMLFSAITIMGFVTEKTAYAETNKPLTVEDYTNSDKTFFSIGDTGIYLITFA